MTQRILLTGGAGYIGSHTYVALVEAGYDVTILDNFQNANRSVIARLEDLTGQPVTLAEADVRDATTLASLFAEHVFDAVVHFAALKAVGESVERPLDYFDVNISGLINLLRVMDAAGCRKIVFSSSATVYGVPDETPTPETAEFRAMNPYGQTKISGEQILNQLVAADDRWQIGILRYFNPAGAHESHLIGEDPRDTPNNLMPFIAKVAAGEVEELEVFGDDYDTQDGTGVRDYIHVDDLARGHVLSVAALLEDGQSHLVNLGTGEGHSVMEMIAAYKRASNRDIPHRVVDRRAGDVPIYVAKADKAEEVLGFRTEKTLDEMCASSWAWITGPHSQEDPDGEDNT
ncbi:UDP-glucose 4-epimerase GalE [Hasllibacter sp. MH4015]|uniref:UDP-glucose 4-epimerase GalE n=1 Tax=Hasllibacter sp. MH4015 TaxID=2854029 RepID=UPI001CD3482C|nr:UDP-glucose 4-epimerase GalE [Hasllibacter sp. MH4015]